MKKKDFGPDFKWGVASSAYQIEGAYKEDGKGLSIWDTFCLKSGNIANNHNGNIACNHYNKWEEDLAIIKMLNIPCYRFSLSWSRILPSGTCPINQPGIDFYNHIIDKCLDLGIEPWITLYHWDLPLELELKGGWTNREIIHWFEDYVKICVSHFGDRVKRWMVLNEPFVFTGAGYYLGIHAPGRKGLKNYLPAVHHAALAQGLGGKIIRDLCPDAIVGTTYSCSLIEPVKNKPRHQAAARRYDALFNRLFLELALGLGYPVQDLTFLKKIESYIKPEDDKLMQFDFDFIGLQNYTREIVKYNPLFPYMKASIIPAIKRQVYTTSLNCEIYPDGIYQLLKKFSSYEKVKEIIITENGAAFHDTCSMGKVDDPKRQKFIIDYLKQILKAKQEGLKVNGYFIWTLLDNMEWSEGFNIRFGLVYVNHITQERIIKSSAQWYKKFLE